MQLIAIVMRMLERYHTDICSKIILTYLNDIPFEKDHTFFSFQIFLTVAIVKKMLEYFHTFFTTFQSKKIALFFFSKKI